MKKITFALIFALIFSFCLVYASAQEATISDDLTRIYFDGYSYVRFDASRVEYGSSQGNVDITLSESQQSVFKEARFNYNQDNSILRAVLTYKDNANLNAYYLREDYLDVYEMLNDDHGNYTVDFTFPFGNTVVISTDFLTSKTEEMTLTVKACRNKKINYVSAISDDRLLEIEKGILLFDDEGFYYIDYNENPYFEEYSLYSTDEEDRELRVHKIVNGDTVASLEAARELYYAEDFGRLEDGSFIDVAGAAVMIAVFGILPALVLIFSLVFTFISKKLYRKLFILCDVLCVAEIAVFTVFMVVLSK